MYLSDFSHAVVVDPNSGASLLYVHIYRVHKGIMVYKLSHTHSILFCNQPSATK